MLLQHDLDRTQDALVLALGIDDAHRLGLGLREYRLHHEAGAEGEALEQRGIFVEILDRPGRDTGVHRGFRDRRRDALNKSGIKGTRDQRARPKALRLAAVEAARHHIRRRIARELRDGVDGGVLHLLVDGGGADIERAAEDEGEAQDVVDLVRKVGAAGADHGVGPRRARLVRHDFGVRIGERHHQRLVAHLLDHVLGQDARRREAEEDIGAADHVGELPLVGLLRVGALPAVHQLGAAFIDHALDVADPDVLALGAERDQQIEAGDRRCARAGTDDLHVGQLLAVQQQRVGDGGADDDGGAMLVVVEHRDLHALLQALLDLEAFRALDVLEIDAAEGRLQRRHRLDHAIDGVGGDLDVEHIDAGEFLEQDRLAFHHGLGGERADIAEPQHGGAVGDDRDQIGARGERSGFGGIADDLGAGRRDARRIGQREVALVGERLDGLDFEFPGTRKPVIGQRRVVQVFGIGHSLPSAPIWFDRGGLWFCCKLVRM